MTIVDDSVKVEVENMRRFLGIMFAMTVTSLCNIMDYWKEEDDGLMSSRFRTKLNMSANRFKFIRQHFNTGDAGRGSISFHAILPIQDMFNSRALRYSDAGIELSLTSPHRDGMARTKSGPMGLLH